MWLWPAPRKFDAETGERAVRMYEDRMAGSVIPSEDLDATSAS
jgi:hypothetical protein